MKKQPKSISAASSLIETLLVLSITSTMFSMNNSVLLKAINRFNLLEQQVHVILQQQNECETNYFV